MSASITLSVAELLEFSRLQMAAEAFLAQGYGGDENLMVDYRLALNRGNGHASKFTATDAERFSSDWEVLAQKENTVTGFSGTLFKYVGETDASRGLMRGELVVSFRSTEFIDDAVRDNMATNTLEVKATGWAWGQMADMKAWMDALRSDPQMLQGKDFSVTGYSLGGHLATAYNLLNPGVAEKVVTFNGAGVGKMAGNGGTLAEALAEFISLRESSDAIRAKLTDPQVLALYDTIRARFQEGGSFPDHTWARSEIAAAYVLEGQEGIQLSPQAQLLDDALAQMQQVELEAARLRGVRKSDGSGAPAIVELANVGGAIPRRCLAAGFVDVCR